MRQVFVFVVVAALATACAARSRSVSIGGFEFTTTSGARSSLLQSIGNAKFTVIEFFSSECPVQKSHDARLVELYRRFSALGVAFIAVDSEVTASAEQDEHERRSRGYPFPIVIDENARFANSVHAEYSTYTLVVDRQGTIRYEGGIDSDRAVLTGSPAPYLSDALDDLLSGREPRLAASKAFGCMLQKW